jgi:hypothetical protein
LDGVVEVEPAMQVVFRPRCQGEGKGQRTSSLRGGSDSVGCMVFFIDRLVRPTGCVFDRATNEPRGGCAPDDFRHVFRSVCKAILKVSAHGQIGGGCNRGDVSYHRFTADRVVLLPDGEGVADTGGGQRFKAELREQPRRADVPGIGNDKSGFPLMEGAKSPSLLNWYKSSPAFQSPESQ